MPECPNCRAPYSAPDNYCSQCGQRVVSAPEPAGDAATRKSLDLVDVYYNLGIVYCRKGQYQQAAETFRKGLDRDPGNRALRDRLDALEPLLADSGDTDASNP